MIHRDLIYSRDQDAYPPTGNRAGLLFGGSREEHVVRAGPFRLLPQRLRVEVGERVIDLKPSEMRLMTLLVHHRGRILTRRVILAMTGDDAEDRDPRAVDVQISRLRRKLGRAGRWIRTVKGAGYTFCAPDTRSPRRLLAWLGAGVTLLVEGWRKPAIAVAAGVTAVAGATVVAMNGREPSLGFRPPRPEVLELEFAASQSDLSGLNGRRSDGLPLDRLGGLNSLGTDPVTGELVSLASAGPWPGGVMYSPRLQRIALQADGGGVLRAEHVETCLLASGPVRAGANFTAFVVMPDGGAIVAEESDNSLHRYDATGQWIERLATPARFAATTNAVSGAARGRGFEALALSPDGGTLFALCQSPLIPDGGGHGRHLRLLVMDLNGRGSREHVVSLEQPCHAARDLVAIPGGRLLLLERDGSGYEAVHHAVISLLDLQGATDVSGVDRLPFLQEPPNIRPVRRQVLLDLFDVLPRERAAQAWEGLAFMPGNEAHQAVLCTNNAFREPTRLLVIPLAARTWGGEVSLQVPASSPRPGVQRVN